MMGLILSPIGRAIAAACLLLLIFGAIYQRGYAAASASCMGRELALQVADLTRQLQRLQQANAEMNRQSEKMATALLEREQKVRTYERDLERRPADTGCLLDRNDERRLRAIR